MEKNMEATISGLDLWSKVKAAGFNWFWLLVRFLFVYADLMLFTCCDPTACLPYAHIALVWLLCWCCSLTFFAHDFGFVRGVCESSLTWLFLCFSAATCA